MDDTCKPEFDDLAAKIRATLADERKRRSRRGDTIFQENVDGLLVSLDSLERWLDHERDRHLVAVCAINFAFAFTQVMAPARAGRARVMVKHKPKNKEKEEWVNKMLDILKERVATDERGFKHGDHIRLEEDRRSKIGEQPAPEAWREELRKAFVRYLRDDLKRPDLIRGEKFTPIE